MKYFCSESSSEYRPNQLFPSNRGYHQRPFYGGNNYNNNRSFSRNNNRGNNSYPQQSRPQNK
jgi:hypothetical protein